jgi:hypothetical protein
MLYDWITFGTSGFISYRKIMLWSYLLPYYFPPNYLKSSSSTCLQKQLMANAALLVLSVIGASESVHQEIRGKVDRYKMKDRKAHLEPSLVNSFFLFILL